MDDLTPGRPQPTTPPPTPAPERIPTPSMSRPAERDSGWRPTAPVQPRRAVSAASTPPAAAAPQSPAGRSSPVPAAGAGASAAAPASPFRRLLAVLTLALWPFVLAGWVNNLDYSYPRSSAWLVTLVTTFLLVTVVAGLQFVALTRLRILATAAAAGAALALMYLAWRATVLSDLHDHWFDLGALFACPGILFGGLALFATGVLLWRELTRFSLPPPVRPPAPRAIVPGQNPTPGRIVADRAARIAAQGRYHRRLPVYLLAALPTLALAAWFGYDAVQWNWRSDSAMVLSLEVINWLGLALCLSCAALALYSHSAFWRIGWLAGNTALTAQLALFGLTTALTLAGDFGFAWLIIGSAALPCLLCSFTALGWQLESARYPRRLLGPGEKVPEPAEDFQLDTGTWDEAKPGGRT